MPYIPLEEHLPGITGLLEYRKDSALPIRELTQFLLRGPNTLSEGERELIATVVSNGNQCTFCTTAHTAAADLLLGENETTSQIKKDINTSSLSPKMKALLAIASMTRESGKSVTAEAIQQAKDEGATDIEIHDTVLIAALFCLYNRYVDGLATALPENSDYYQSLAERLTTIGYNRLSQGYDHLKKQNTKKMETGIANPSVSLTMQESKITAKLVLVFVICFFATFFSGIISMLMSVYLPVAVKDLLGNVTDARMNTISAWINCVFIFGWMFGGIVWGVICDKIGRSKAVALSIACSGIFAIITGLSASWFFVSTCRFLTGFGIGGILVTTTVLISELWDEKKKAVVMGIVSLAMPVGFFAAGIINNITEDWRTAFLVGIIPLLLAVIAYFTLPESIEWKTNRLTKNKVSFNQLFAPVYKKNLLIGSVVFGTMLIGLWAIFSWAPTWVQSISASENVQQQRGLTMMILAGGGITGSFFSGWIVNAIGLRKTMLLCFAVCFIMTFVVFKLNATVTTATFAEMAILSFFFGISQGALAVYIPSLFPTGICASATGFCFNVGRLFTGTVVFFIGALETLLGGYGNAIFTFSFIFIIGFIVTFLTKEKTQNVNI